MVIFSYNISPLDLKEEPMNPKLFDYDAVNGEILGNLLEEKLYGDMDSFCQSIVQRFEKKNMKLDFKIYTTTLFKFLVYNIFEF